MNFLYVLFSCQHEFSHPKINANINIWLENSSWIENKIHVMKKFHDMNLQLHTLILPQFSTSLNMYDCVVWHLIQLDNIKHQCYVAEWKNVRLHEATKMAPCLSMSYCALAPQFAIVSKKKLIFSIISNFLHCQPIQGSIRKKLICKSNWKFHMEKAANPGYNFSREISREMDFGREISRFPGS